MRSLKHSTNSQSCGYQFLISSHHHHDISVYMKNIRYSILYCKFVYSLIHRIVNQVLWEKGLFFNISLKSSLIEQFLFSNNFHLLKAFTFHQKYFFTFHCSSEEEIMSSKKFVYWGNASFLEKKRWSSKLFRVSIGDGWSVFWFEHLGRLVVTKQHISYKQIITLSFNTHTQQLTEVVK